jgi:MFS family permease
VTGAARPRLFAGRDFRLWYLARSASVAGTAASAVALPLLAYRHTGSAGLTAAVVGLEALPYLLFGLFAGAAADRLRRRAMMIGADLGCALLLLTLPAAASLHALTTGHVLGVAFGVGCGFCWFDAASWGARMRLAGAAGIAQANSVMWSTEVVLGVAVPAGAGLVAVATDPTLVLALDAATYLVSAALIARIGTDLDPTPDARNARRRLRDDIGEGVAYVWRQPVLRSLSLAGCCLNVAVGGSLGLLVVHADQVLGVSTSDGRIGAIHTSCAVGSLIAALALPAAARRFGPGPVSVAGQCLFVLAVVALAVTSAFAAALALWVVWAYARITVNGTGITVRQLLTPDALQGRVNTVGRMIAWGGTPVGALAGGLIADAAGIRVAYLTLAVVPVIGVGLLLGSPVRLLRVATG